jgi:hypothetical protein
MNIDDDLDFLDFGSKFVTVFGCISITFITAVITQITIHYIKQLF